MPEEIEFESPSPHEEAHSPHHQLSNRQTKPADNWMRFVPLSTAMLAVVAAIAALQSSVLVNEALLEQGKAAQSQAQSSDTWAYFQAKGMKANSAEQTADLMAANPAQAAKVTQYQEEAKRYRTERQELESKARNLEKKRDEENGRAHHCMHRHHPFAYCVTFTQIAIALSAIAALTRRRMMWFISMVVGLIGVAHFMIGWINA